MNFDLGFIECHLCSVLRRTVLGNSFFVNGHLVSLDDPSRFRPEEGIAIMIDLITIVKFNLMMLWPFLVPGLGHSFKRDSSNTCRGECRRQYRTVLLESGGLGIINNLGYLLLRFRCVCDTSTL